MAEPITLLELLRRLGSTINTSPELQSQWVVAEISDLRPSGGHRYFSIIQKDNSGQVVANMRATLWRGTASSLAMRYGEKFHALLANGNEVKLRCSVSFHEKYGLSVNVTDLDPDYRRDTSRLQAEIIATLTREGILEKNKQREMPWPVQRVAIISSAGAAGYGDFMNQLHRNQYGLQFYTKLFEATVQGVNTAPTVCAAIEEVESYCDLFDCIVIIRGGGATTDLAGFDDLKLARTVANCGLPVIVGISHERDNTVLDFIAHTRCKTPTAAAEWLILQGAQALSQAIDLAGRIATDVKARLTDDTRHLASLEQLVPMLARNRRDAARALLDKLTSTLPLLVRGRIDSSSQLLDRASRAVESVGQNNITRASAKLNNFIPLLRQSTLNKLQREQVRLQNNTEKVALLSPKGVLARGYSITLTPDGRALRTPSQAPEGTLLRSILSSGEITSIVS